jgi:ribose-phosphate pyrophosphokinase
LGLPLSNVDIIRLSEGEIRIKVLDERRGKDIFLIQSTSNPVNENLFELLLLVSALRKGSAKSITVIFPYYSYARSDQRMNSKEPIAAADVAKMLEIAGVDRTITVELHSQQTQGFFSIPTDNLETNIIMVDFILNSNLIHDYNKLVIVSPDANGVYRAKKFSEILIANTSANIGLSMLIRERQAEGKPIVKLVGDVKDCECIILDDMIDSGDTVINAANELFNNGAKHVYAFSTHGI